MWLHQCISLSCIWIISHALILQSIFSGNPHSVHPASLLLRGYSVVNIHLPTIRLIDRSLLRRMTAVWKIKWNKNKTCPTCTRYSDDNPHPSSTIRKFWIVVVLQKLLLLLVAFSKCMWSHILQACASRFGRYRNSISSPIYRHPFPQTPLNCQIMGPHASPAYWEILILRCYVSWQHLMNAHEGCVSSMYVTTNVVRSLDLRSMIMDHTCCHSHAM